jgi:hypothetical protein
MTKPKLIAATARIVEQRKPTRRQRLRQAAQVAAWKRAQSPKTLPDKDLQQ